ncbi:MAG: hypothetical protein DPW09_02005 [Anaerolineae bacterium]|nr:hypothetical protein [Anaerolineae bacterium]
MGARIVRLTLRAIKGFKRGTRPDVLRWVGHAYLDINEGNRAVGYLGNLNLLRGKPGNHGLHLFDQALDRISGNVENSDLYLLYTIKHIKMYV